MASLAAIRTALVSTITSTVSGINGYDTVPGTINTPAFLVVPRSTDFQKAFGRGIDTYSFDVIVLVSRADDGLAQDALDPFINGFGSSSIRAALFATRDLGVDVDASVTGMSDYGGQYDIGGVTYVGARLNVEVLTSGTA